MKNSIVLVTQELDTMEKKVKQLQIQIKSQAGKNQNLQSKLRDLRKVSPIRSKSPISILQESLGLDRLQLCQKYSPIKEQEVKYMRNERIKTEYMIYQSRTQELKEKRRQVLQIDQFEQSVPLRVQEYQRNKMLQARQKESKFVEQTQKLAQKKISQIVELQKEERHLFDQLMQAKREEIKLKLKFHEALQSPNDKLPLITKSSNKISSTNSYKTPTSIKRPVSPMTMDKYYKYQFSDSTDDQLLKLNSAKIKSRSIENYNYFTKACQTSLSSQKYSMNFDSYQASNKNGKSISIQSQIPEEIDTFKQIRIMNSLRNLQQNFQWGQNIQNN
ncbi:hypothetical protein pb186bvf_019409 [Paramecium bursaria]